MKILLIVAAALGVILVFLLATASADTTLFSRHYPTLIALNGSMLLALLGLLGWQLRQLWRDYRQQVFGARLKLRLMAMFGLMAVIPGLLIYGVSVQFLTKSIESWFDVRVEKALEAGLNLGRSVLDAQVADLLKKGRVMALELGARPDRQRAVLLNQLREQTGVETIAIYTQSGQILATAVARLDERTPPQPTPTQLRQARLGRGAGSVESDGAALLLRVLVPVMTLSLGEETQILQLTQAVPESVAHNADAVQEVYRDYEELSLGRQGLTQIYALTLTLTVLLALFSAFALAFVLARRLSAPLSLLAEGTQAVAAGDFSPRQAIYSRDELGMLTQHFSRMTRQLDDARRDADRHRAEVEAARAWLESILANLSAGVLVLDRRFILRTVNASARVLLDEDFTGLVGETIDAWPRQIGFGRRVRDEFTTHGKQEWQQQIEREREDALPQTLLLRGSRLPEASGGGFVVVFDDVTQLIAAQRSAAWGEVARRLAHEIKNPLTPIQLSAERMHFKLADKLAGHDLELLTRSTQTIINQVQAMKRMVDDFRDYARMPPPQLATVDLNALVREVLGLYESSSATLHTELAEGLPLVQGDATQLRQIIHNLLRNAEDAQEGQADSRIEISTRTQGKQIELLVADNGPGVPAELMARLFDPYVTTKARGTGLGLAIVKKIVDEHWGKVNIHNRQPHGAQVRILLPCPPEE